VEDIADLLDVDDIEVPEELMLPRFNIAPQAGVLAVANRRVRPLPGSATPAVDDATAGVANFRRRLTAYHWGLVPSWSKEPSAGNRSFNARAETLATRPAFRTALAKRRCLIPADAFYEWQKVPNELPGAATRPHATARKGVARLPWCFRPANGGLLVFAGLWEAWRPPRDAGRPAGEQPDLQPPDQHGEEAEGWHDDWLLSCSIITTSANGLVATIHDRMPVVLQPEDWAAWLEPAELDPLDLDEMLAPAPEGYLTGYRVGSEVNNSRLDEPKMVEPLRVDNEAAPEPGAPTLFDVPGLSG
jgi:putative SOS response-associated peptidase YedK